MRYMFRFPETGQIILEDGEDPRDALRVIAQASYAAAPSTKRFFKSSRNGSGLTNAEAEACFIWQMGAQLAGLEMGVVKGRLCNTCIYPDVHDRNVWRLDRTRFLLRCTDDTQVFLQAEIAMLVGAPLDRRLSHFQQSRLHNESDWDFRRRVFPSLWEWSPSLALSILLGPNNQSSFLFDQDQIAHLLLSRPTREKLQQFVATFSVDPLADKLAPLRRLSRR